MQSKVVKVAELQAVFTEKVLMFTLVVHKVQEEHPSRVSIVINDHLGIGASRYLGRGACSGCERN